MSEFGVCVSVGGRFHAFDLARQLERRGHLARLITSYPAWKASEWEIPRTKVASILSHELINRIYQRVPAGWLDPDVTVHWMHERFDRLAARRLPDDSRIFVGFASLALQSIRRARALGQKTILERGSCHIQTQWDLLSEEYERFGMPARHGYAPLIERELAEYQEADYVCVPSSFARRTFIERGFPAERIIQVPYGVELDQFRPGSKHDQVFRVIHCGALTLQKGVQYLVQAFHELALPNAELWLIGHAAPEILPVLARYQSPTIIAKGTFPQSELHALYAQGSVFCLASVQDGFGMVIPQAMACGLPVICSENTAGGDIVREGVDGYVVPIRDVAALKQRLLALYEQPELARAMGESARARVSEGFTWDDYGRQMVAAYERVLYDGQPCDSCGSAPGSSIT